MFTRGWTVFWLSLSQALLIQVKSLKTMHIRVCRIGGKRDQIKFHSHHPSYHLPPMSSRLQPLSASASSAMSHSSIPRSHTSLPSTHSNSSSQSGKVWVDPASLPDYGEISSISGNAPDYVKQLNCNTYFSYGVGDEDCFGHKVGKSVKFVEVSVDRRLERQGRMEATTVAEVVVTRRSF